jgi:type III secretory pathway component EscU
MYMGILKEVPLLGRIVELGYTMFLVILISAIIGLILAYPVQLLWNFVFGDLYKITVLQAWALNVLAGILFGKGGSSKK